LGFIAGAAVIVLAAAFAVPALALLSPVLLLAGSVLGYEFSSMDAPPTHAEGQRLNAPRWDL
jgi:hypothetical protein